MKLSIKQLTRCLMLAVFFVAGTGTYANADIVSFLVDADDWDANGDGFINGTEFMPTGTDGTVWTFTPGFNPGIPSLQLDEDTGLKFGGSGNSSWEFEFFASHDVLLESYSLTDTFGFAGSPDFRLELDGTLISSGNASGPQGNTFAFNDGPFLLAQGSTMNFVVESPGAGRTSFLAGFNYSSAVPEPTSGVIMIGLSGLVILRRRRVES